MDERLDFVAATGDAGRRIDIAVAQHAHRSRRASAELIRAGHVRVNGAAVKASYQLAAGDRVAVSIPPPAQSVAMPQAIPIRLVYEDADLCVVDKPAGIVTHPAPGNQRDTLVNALLAAIGPLPSTGGGARAGIVHRLDKDTSGLLVVAKSDTAMRALSSAMAARRIVREYDAVIWGMPPSAAGTIEAPLGRDPRDRTRFAVRAEGRRAVTHYRVAEEFAGHALLELRLETGRTHQIRVHCMAIGNPIVGDLVYGAGKPRMGMARQALHAARLRLEHPRSGEPLSFAAPWPEDFARLVQRLRAGSSA